MFSRLKTDLWASALMRRAQTAGAFAMVLSKGDPDAGAVIVKVRTPDGLVTLYRSMQNITGARIWHPTGPEEERDIDGRITKARERDPDLWVIEIEDREGRHFLTETVESN